MMRYKFNVGDKVRFIGNWDEIDNDDVLRKYDCVTISKCINLFNLPFYTIAEDNGDSFIKEDALKLVEKVENVRLKCNINNKKPTREELFNMPKGTKIYTDAKEDNEFVYDGNRFNSLNKFLYKSNISEALKIVDDIAPEFSTDFGTHVTKIEVPTDYEIIYDITEKNMESLREENERLIRQVAELKEKLNEKNNQDIKISKQELDIMNDFFERR